MLKQITLRKWVCFLLAVAFVLSINMAFSAKAVDFSSTHSHDSEDYFEQTQPRMFCNNCNAGMTYLRCLKVWYRFATDTHNTGAFGSGETCTRIWYSSTYQHVCDNCGHVVAVVSGHTCLIQHSICANESWCRDGEYA